MDYVTLSIQNFLRENGLEAAVAKWNLRVVEEGNLVQLNYHMIDSPNGVQECNECRGLILDKANNYSVIAYPFYRFYNESEGHAATPNLSASVLQEKLDGSMLILYWHPYNNEWTVATRGTILASGSVGNLDKTFKDLFWETVKEAYPLCDFDVLPTFYTFTFELIGPENRILNLYEKNELRLTGARSNYTLHEVEDSGLADIAAKLGIPRPKTYSFSTKESIFEIFETLKPIDEGFVLVDYSTRINGNFQRIKIKNPRYLALHHLLGAGDDDLMNNKRVVRLIRSGDIDEVIVYFPEYEPQIREMRNRLDNLASSIQSDYERLKNLGVDKKAFAEEAKKTSWCHALFAINNGKAKDAIEFVQETREESLMEMIK